MKKSTVKNKDQTDFLKKFEKNICIIVFIILLIMISLCFVRIEFLPATLIIFSLQLFCLCYYYRDNDEQKLLIYTMFGLGIGTLIFAVFYTLMETM